MGVRGQGGKREGADRCGSCTGKLWGGAGRERGGLCRRCFALEAEQSRVLTICRDAPIAISVLLAGR